MAASKKPVVRPDWDADSPTLHANLARVDVTIHHLAVGRMPPSVEDARRWHLAMMQGLDPGDPVYVGAFRGEPGLETVGVEVDGAMGTMPWDVEAELQRFEERLALTVSRLDALYPDDASLDDNGRTAVIEVAAWTHSEWVRIHPFANGNGRTARMWANLILLRYGMPPVLRMRPRPDASDYGTAGAAGMKGNNAPMAALIRRLHDATLSSPATKGPAKRTPAKKAAAKRTTTR